MGETVMSNSAFESNPAFTKLNQETRQVVTQAFDAMSNWRSQLAQMGQKNSDAVFDKMVDAAKSLGWPTDFVELCRQQMQNASEMQLHAIDQIMNIWEKQLTSINPNQISSLPSGVPNFPSFSSMPGMSGGAGNPMQFWVQAAEMWQKGWQQAMSGWMEAQQNAMKNSGLSDKGRR
jgi:hypothetical protein